MLLFGLLNKPLYYILINPNTGVDSDLTTLWFSIAFDSDSSDTFYFKQYSFDFVLGKKNKKVLLFLEYNKKKVGFFSASKTFKSDIKENITFFFFFPLGKTNGQLWQILKEFNLS